jgi:hypothetical protein
MEQLSWEETEPRYLELAATPLSRDTLPAWLAEWSRLSDLLEETQMRLWIECVRDTTSPERAEQRGVPRTGSKMTSACVPPPSIAGSSGSSPTAGLSQTDSLYRCGTCVPGPVTGVLARATAKTSYAPMNVG